MPDDRTEAAPVRAMWSGTITFGLVSIPVDLLSAVRARQTAMHLVDAEGYPLGREYYCPEDGERVEGDDIVRGYGDEEEGFVVVTDEELESVAPEMSRDIELRRFVPLEQIPPAYFDRPYYLAPSVRSTKAYHLLAETMERTGRVGIGTFVMRGHEYLVAILSEGGLLRAETLRFSDELRTPDYVGLPERPKVPAKRVRAMRKAIAAHAEDELDLDELSDEYARSLHDLAHAKAEEGRDVIELLPEDELEEPAAEVVDLMDLIKRRMGATPKPAAGTSPTDLSELSKKQLYERARSLDIPGRSTMDRKALERAIRRAS